MPDFINTEAPEQFMEFKNRKTGLMLFGILLLIMGGICALMLSFSLVVLIIDQSAGTNTTPLSSMIIGISYYAVLPLALVWLGIGSISAKRWARALILIGSWFSLVFGVFALFLMATLMPDIFDQLVLSGQAEPKVMAVFQIILYAFFI